MKICYFRKRVRARSAASAVRSSPAPEQNRLDKILNKIEAAKGRRGCSPGERRKILNKIEAAKGRTST